MRIRGRANVQWANITHMVQPGYPEDARQKRISGTVMLHVLVAADGTVKKVESVSGQPELMDSSIEAIKQWHYSPTLRNHQSVEVDSTINLLSAPDRKGALKPPPRNH
jgi:TonB family protein